MLVITVASSVQNCLDLVNFDQFLHLGSSPRVGSVFVSGDCSILTGSKYQGQVYIKGILVCNLPNLLFGSVFCFVCKSPYGF